MGLQVIALGCLIGAIVLGFVKKTNVGLVCFGLALILGKIGGMGASDIYKGFPFKLFATLLGTMLFFSLLQQNGTLEKISDRLIGLCGKHLFLVPIIIYVVSFGLSAAGPGAISVQSVTVLFAVALAVQMKVSPILMGVMAILGAVGGTASPIALTGIIVGDMMTEMGIEGSINNIFIGVSVSNFVCAVAMYILLGGYKLRGNAESGEKKVEKFTRDQWLSLIALVIMVVLVVGCFTLAMILILLGTADEKKAIKAIPWSVLILIAGVNVLMNITQTMGGIDLLSSILASFMTKRTAGPIMGFTAGLMSWFSSANGVVFPTLIPTVPDIASQVGGASVMQIITAIVCSATVAGISPLSTGGSLILASYAQETDCGGKEQQKMFGTLFALSATVVVIVCVLTFVGVTSFVG